MDPGDVGVGWVGVSSLSSPLLVEGCGAEEVVSSLLEGAGVVGSVASVAVDEGLADGMGLTVAEGATGAKLVGATPEVGATG